MRVSSQPFEPDLYAGLLQRTRVLSSEAQFRRGEWFERLPLTNKHEVLFEFEALLKGLVCFINPRNHSGPARRSGRQRQFGPKLQLVTQGVRRCIELATLLLTTSREPPVIRRNLPNSLPASLGPARSTLVSPEQSLQALRRALHEILSVLALVPDETVTRYAQFQALLAPLAAHIQRSEYFCSLYELEFCPEHDAIEAPEIIDLIARIPHAEARRVTALTLLCLLRLLAYLNLLSKILDSRTEDPNLPSRVQLLLSVSRADSRALCNVLERYAGQSLASGFSERVFRYPSAQLPAALEGLESDATALLMLRRTLLAIVANLRLEVRRAYHHDLPPPAANHTQAATLSGLRLGVSRMRASLNSLILFLGDALGGDLTESTFRGAPLLDRDTSDRLRRNAWMFAQIVRAFYTKAQHHSDVDSWAAPHGYKYISEFLAYLRAMGLQVLRQSQYPKVEPFLFAIHRLQDLDLVDRARLDAAIDECLSLHGFLQEFFANISETGELVGIDFNRRAAATELRLYLGDQNR